MKKNFQRVAAFIMAVMMVLTMSNWNGIATVAKAAGTVTDIYFYNGAGWDNVYIATWNSESYDTTFNWSTIPLAEAPDLGTGWYVVDEVPEGTDTVVFHNNGDAISNTYKSGDITVTSGVSQYIVYSANPEKMPETYEEQVGTWENYGDDLDAALAAIGGDNSASTRMYFYNGANWEDVYAYVYGNNETFGIWPGTKAAVSELGSRWYYADVPYGQAAIIFNNGKSGYDDGERKTGDISMADGQTQYIVYSSDSAEAVGVYTTTADEAEAKAAAASLSNGENSEGIVYVYIPGNIVDDWKNSSHIPALIYESNSTGEEVWQYLNAVDRYPGWYEVNVPISDVKLLKVAAPYDSWLGWPDDGNCPVDEARVITASSWTDGTIAIQWNDNSTYPVGELADQLGTGNPGDLHTYDGVWYYNPDWSGSDVYLHYQCTLLNNWGKPVSVKAAESMPGWFYVDGAQASSSLYKVIKKGVGANAVVILFSKGAELNQGAQVEFKYTDVEGDGGEPATDFSPYADVLYFGGSSAYDSVEDLADAFSQADYPGADGNNLVAYYYAGTEKDNSGARLTTGWNEVYADIYFYKKGTTEKVLFKNNVKCVNDGDGWFYVNTELDATNKDCLENGVYIQFKYGTESTAAYEFRNNYRAYATSQMSIFKSKDDAVDSLTNTVIVNDVPADKVRVWFFYPGGWSDYYVFYSTAAGGGNSETQSYSSYSQLVKQGAYVSENGGNWYYADVPADTNYIYFDEDDVFNNGGNISQKYDISGKTANEIFCVVNDSIITNGWSTSTAEIVKYYDLANAPASNEISMPVTILDYNADNLFFEYDMNYLRNMTLVLGNMYGKGGMDDMGVTSTITGYDPWPTIDGENRPGDAPHYDRNGKEYVSGVLEDKLVNGYPVYTQKAVTYIAKVVQKGFQYYGGEGGTNQDYNKTDLFKTLYSLIKENGYSLGTYQESEEKYTKDFNLATYDVTRDSTLTCMDYAYYVLNNLYNSNSNYNKDYGMYSYLVLKRTSPNVYGFYANYQTSLPTAENLPQNYPVVYDPSLDDGKGFIYNNVNSDGVVGEDKYYYVEEGSNKHVTMGYIGMFPYDPEYIEKVYGEGKQSGANQSTNNQNLDYFYYDYDNLSGVEYTDAYSSGFQKVNNLSEQGLTGNQLLHNYGYTLKLNGKFRFDFKEDLYFTFTGDDDVVLYINGKKVLDLSGAHEAVSYTIYLSDLVQDGITHMEDGEYYDLDFFYMERHSTWSNMRIETNIDVIDVTGQVQKRCYDTEGKLIPNGTTMETNSTVTYEYELNAGSGDGLANLVFEDPALGVSISSEKIELGSYVDENGNTVERKVGDLVVSIGSTVYRNMTEEQLKTVLESGIAAGERILISNIPHVLTSGVDGPVTATMNGATDGRELSSTAGHVIYIGDPSISVTNTAANTAGTNLPNNTVLQSGTVADYTITLKNTGGVALYNTGITDEKLGVAFSVAEDGTVTAQLNEYTEPQDLTITIHGTGVDDGIYKASSQEELENIISKLTQVVYPTGATLEISGIKHPIVETFLSTAVGTADSLTDYRGWNEFGKDYLAYLQSGGAEPDYTKYVTIPEGQENLYEGYANTYKTYVISIKDNGVLNTEVPDVKVAGFVIGKQVTDDASLTLNAKQSNYTYYSQAGQIIQFTLQNETVVDLVDSDPEGTDNWDKTAIAEAGTFELSKGSHMVTTYYKNYTQDSNGGFNIYSIILADQNGNETELKVDYVNDTGYIKDGTNVQIYDNDAVALNQPGDAITYPVEIPADGTYTVKVQYASAVETKQAAVVFDYMPGDYVLTTVDGADLNPVSGTADTKAEYTVNNAAVTVDNTGAYPVIQYTCQEGIQEVNTFGVRVTGAAETVKPDTVTITSYDVTDDVYVLDYGLNVDLTDTAYQNGLFQNDKLSVNADREEVSFLGVQAVDSKLDTGAGYRYVYSKDGYGETAEGAYGTVAKDGNGTGASAVYKLNKFLEGIDRYTYAVQAGLKDAAEKNMTTSTPVMEANITIMPATVVYYEDNFSSVITNGTAEGTPDADREQGNGLEIQYGYDQAYQNDGTFSNNGYTALSGTDKFAFTFKGTGFDILTRTADADLKVSVYDVDQYELKSYTYGEGKVFISVVKKADAWADAKVLKTVTVNASYENGTVDQIPLISVDLEKHGSYIVLAQRIGDGGEALKVDGIRIYNPLGTITDEEVADAYDKAEGEKGAEVSEIRSMIFGEGYAFDYTNPADPSTAQITEGSGAVAGLVQMTGNQINIATGSTVVECYTGAMTSADIAAEKAENPVNTSSLLSYAVSGPNNELYLTGEAYAFAAVVNDIGDSSMLQIGLKAVKGTAAVQYRAADGNWKDIPDAESLSASLEMYYRIPAADLWQSNGKTVLMVRAINGTASLTHLKYQDVTFEKITREAFGDVVAGDQNDSSFNIMSSGAAGTKAVLTFSVSDQVKDFTITNKNTGEKVFTYGTAEALPSGITVSRRAADGLTIYVVKMPKTAGTYTITTSTGDSFGTAEFEIQ